MFRPQIYPTQLNLPEQRSACSYILHVPLCRHSNYLCCRKFDPLTLSYRIGEKIESFYNKF